MKALVWTGGKKLKLTERQLPYLKHGEALVRVRAAAICATDLRILSGRAVSNEPPLVLGHEFAGQVEKTGEGSFSEWVGKRVFCDPVVSCGICPECRSGRKHLCLQGGELGATGGDGGYAEYAVVPVANLYHLPDRVSYEEGALLEPLNRALGAISKAQTGKDESVLIFGDGPAGLLFLQLVRSLGCSPVYIIGGGRVRTELAAKLGADGVFDHRDRDLEKRIMEATEGEGPDLAIEASGAEAAVRQAFQWVKPGGKLVLYGLASADRSNVHSNRIIGKDISVYTGIGAPLLWNEALGLVTQDKVRLKELVTQTFPLEKASEALALAGDPDRSVKVVLKP